MQAGGGKSIQHSALSTQLNTLSIYRKDAKDAKEEIWIFIYLCVRVGQVLLAEC